jgi:murein DD-endopeptidase MepM/ murein hydrolase activator NlpD
MNLSMPFNGNYPITQTFGANPGSYHYICRSDGSHNGIDYGLPMSTPVLAAAAGSVTVAGMDTTGYGLHVRVLHADGTLTLYAHFSQITVTVNQPVRAGQQLGLSGMTGDATGPHLHFEIRTRPNDCTSAIDPQPLLTGNPQPQPQPQPDPTPKPVPAPTNLTPLFNAKVTATVLNVRSGPDTTYPVVRQLNLGDALTVYDLGGPTVWVQIGPGEFCAFRYNSIGYLVPA